MSQDTETLLSRLRSDLDGWTVDATDALLGPVARDALAREQPLPAVLVTRDRADDPLATLLAVFVLGREVPRRRLADALPHLGVDGAIALGLVEAAGNGPGDPVRALLELRPYAAVDDAGTAQWWVLSDLGDMATGAPLRADHVLGVGGASTTLARCTVRTPVDRVLDIGTGCGVQALHAARHAGRITGTDTSARALRLTRMAWSLNAPQRALGGSGDVELDLRRGDLLEPVAGERYDLVVSNPPFVISPKAAGTIYEYRDGGLVGDALVRRLVEGVGAVLAPGGVAQMLANWEHVRGEAWTDRVGAWLDAAGAAGGDLDGWVVQREVQDPAEYAELWMRDAGQHVGPAADALYEAWLADFAARDVEAVGFGLVTLRRPAEGTTRTLRRLEDRSGAPSLPPGHEIAAALAAHDWLTARDDAALLGARLRVAADLTEERHHRPGEEDPAVILLRRGAGSGRTVQASTALTALVGACDGELPVGAIVGALGTLLERGEGELRAELLPAVRDLIRDGLLSPA